MHGLVLLMLYFFIHWELDCGLADSKRTKRTMTCHYTQ